MEIREEKTREDKTRDEKGRDEKEKKRDEKIVPRYVHAPALRDYGMGPRNLFWGVGLLIVASVMLVVAILLVGSKAMISVATCLLTFTALFVLTRMHVFRQRNGGFLAVGLVCLIGAAVPLLESAFTAAKTFVSVRTTGSSAAFRVDEPAPLLTQSFALAQPSADAKQVRVLRDSRVVIAGKPFEIKAGDRFLFVGTKGDETAFGVRDLNVSLPSSVVEVVDPKAVAKEVPATAANPLTSAASAPAAPKAAAKAKAGGADDAELAEITRSAQQEAMRRYPALALKDSLENAMFVSTYKQLREAGSDNFFSNPEWPIELAELLAKREGWSRGGSPLTTGPAPVLDAPAEAPIADAPAAEPPAAEPPVAEAPVPVAQPVQRALPVAPVAQPAARPKGPPAALPPISALDAGASLPQTGGR
ncbi:hypothetical protein CfE428DRAFT_0296 [Chthoniobacter flavus Ellin428]|uniref:Uncharacterized protein n=1 Tax=Chthoniobacter flavus Ellin428 TaxID=497964 RepID=B4CUD3_9BACT|nr:hypothetical protein [Chthoniobacter flavus]EDY22171.1 hypothetical protein CfE428DRAFT_0296 [Chthoniobacter flavus Ellin428]TCO94800.1 hypothetical protein EV701_102269 [Chthoniobacter flavus]